MRKTQAQRNKEHVARLRRKAKTLDVLLIQLNAFLDVPSLTVCGDPVVAAETIRFVVREAELAVQE